MPDQFTHLLWGYMLSREISQDKRLIIFGMFMAMLPDLDAFLPWMKHHGVMHTLLFLAVSSCCIYYLARRTELSPGSGVITRICLVNLFFHLFLDTIGTGFNVMWFYPLDREGFALGAHISLASLIAIKLILISVPLAYVANRYHKHRENPLDLMEFLKENLGNRITYILIIAFVVMSLWSIFTFYIAGIG